VNLYVTSDTVGTWTGGGSVTFNESEALKELGSCEVWDHSKLSFSHGAKIQEPWYWDETASDGIDRWGAFRGIYSVPFPKLVHFYAGCFTNTVASLKRNGCKVTYMAAAHDKEESRREYIDMGLDYDRFYPHMVVPELWARYVKGYLDADVVIVPSRHSEQVMRGFGAKNRIEVIPHGVNVPDESALRPPPKTFTVAYIGATGADKGVRYLLSAWKKLEMRDAKLILGGPEWETPPGRLLVQMFGGGNIEVRGRVKNVAEFYDAASVLVQPSVSEGFGLTVLEAMAHDRPVICSTGAGASDLVPERFLFEPRRVDQLCDRIEAFRQGKLEELEFPWRDNAKYHDWGIIRERYKSLWLGLLEKS
jgi:glycosyltransferase involved in cell wall biosynthesis